MLLITSQDRDNFGMDGTPINPTYFAFTSMLQMPYVKKNQNDIGGGAVRHFFATFIRIYTVIITDMGTCHATRNSSCKLLNRKIRRTSTSYYIPTANLE